MNLFGKAYRSIELSLNIEKIKLLCQDVPGEVTEFPASPSLEKLWTLLSISPVSAATNPKRQLLRRKFSIGNCGIRSLRTMALRRKRKKPN